ICLLRSVCVALSLCERGHQRVLHFFPTRRSSDLWIIYLIVAHFVFKKKKNKALDSKVYTIKEGQAVELIDVKPKKHRLLGSLIRSEEHTSELQSRFDIVCRLLLAKKRSDRRAACR